MKLKVSKCFLLVSLILIVVPTVSAHTPLKPDEDIHSLETAFEIENPTKSWALYRELHEAAEAEYYKLQLKPGERLRNCIYVPTTEEPSFAPNLAVMGPGIESMDALPEFVETPDEVGRALIEASRPSKPEFEPFTPSSYYYLADFDLEVSTGGIYYFAVYEQFRGGRYGIAVGYKEEFTIYEWLKIPLDVIGIHLWEGQPLIIILAPMLGCLILGFGLLVWKSRLGRDTLGLVATIAGLLYLGGGFMSFMQMIIALNKSGYTPWALLTIIFVSLPILLGFIMLRKTTRGPGVWYLKDRAIIAALGLLGLFFWAGLLLGPALALLASILPVKK